MLVLTVKSKMSIAIGADIVNIIYVKPKFILIKIQDDFFVVKKNNEFFFNEFTILYYKYRLVAIDAPTEIKILRNNAVKRTKRGL
ncbi:MAG: hypothetical protein GY739_19365 [Mesoflavibacter sp.]|nr:hypothetical protein [Mesoflavibacter sp.]